MQRTGSSSLSTRTEAALASFGAALEAAATAVGREAEEAVGKVQRALASKQQQQAGQEEAGEGEGEQQHVPAACEDQMRRQLSEERLELASRLCDALGRMLPALSLHVHCANDTHAAASTVGGSSRVRVRACCGTASPAASTPTHRSLSRLCCGPLRRSSESRQHGV
jgi:hypothetical protein